MRCIYLVALIFSILFTISCLFTIIYYSDDYSDNYSDDSEKGSREMNKMNFYMYLSMIIAYTILPFAYFWTLYQMYASMKGLPEQKAI